MREAPTLPETLTATGAGKMNKENILRVADAIEQHSIPDLGFNMGWLVSSTGMAAVDRSGHNCGTIACIAGYAHVLEHGLPEGGKLLAGMENFVGPAMWLGLDRKTAKELFFADSIIEPRRNEDGEWVGPIFDSMSEISPSHAVATLRHLAETGEVDWLRAIEDAP